MGTTQQKVSGSHERKSSLVSHKNGYSNGGHGNNYSMLNNSSMMEDNLNYSKEYSYIKDNHNDLSHIYASGGGVNTSFGGKGY